MLCQFKVNLGSNDAHSLELDFSACVAGAKVEVSDQAGAWLVGKGIAIDVSPPKPKLMPKPVPIVADPPRVADELRTVPEEPKPEPKVEPAGKKK